MCDHGSLKTRSDERELGLQSGSKCRSATQARGAKLTIPQCCACLCSVLAKSESFLLRPHCIVYKRWKLAEAAFISPEQAR